MNKSLSISSAVLFAVAWFVIEYIFVGVLALAVIPLFTGGFVLWWFTTRRTPIDPNKIITPYLVTVILFIAHVYEEYTTFIKGLPHVMQGLPIRLNLEFILTFAATLGPILWLLGAIMLLKRWPAGYFGLSTFLFGMMFIEPTHWLAPFLQDGTFHYVGGMWTAVPLVASAWYMFLCVLREIRIINTHAQGLHGTTS